MSRFDESIFGRIALFNDYISKDQLESILQIRRNPKEARDSDKQFGQLALAAGHIRLEDLEAGLLGPTVARSSISTFNLERSS